VQQIELGGLALAVDTFHDEELARKFGAVR